MKCFLSVVPIIALLIAGCGNKQEKRFSLESDKTEAVIIIPDSLPTYEELIMPIQKSGIGYQPRLFEVMPEMKESREQLALQTGVIMADMAFFRHFERVSESKKYTEELDKRFLSLDISQEEVRSVVEQLETHMYEPDSLVIILSSGFDRLTEGLVQSQRSALAAMLMCGVWLEAGRLMLNSVGFEESLSQEEVWKKHAVFGQKLFPMLENFTDNKVRSLYADFVHGVNMDDAKILSQNWVNEIKTGNWESSE